LPRECWVCRVVRRESSLTLETDWRNRQVLNSDRALAGTFSWVCVAACFGSTCCCCHLEQGTGSRKGRGDLSSLLQFNAVLVVVVALRARHHPGLDGMDWKQKVDSVGRIVT